MSKQQRPIMVVSNRLPIVMKEQSEGEWTVAPGSGGLITALRPVLQRLNGSWIGWPGSAEGAPLDDLLDQVGNEMNIRFSGVELDPDLIDGYYYGFSNETLWPIFHDLLGHAHFEESNWRSYIEANDRFAEAIHASVRPEEIIWIHDYQLILTGRLLRERKVENRLAYFLHIPFPPPDIYMRLPWRTEILEALLEYDVIGFQAPRDSVNFANCIRRLLPKTRVNASKKGVSRAVLPNGKTVKFGSFPISIDSKEFNEKAGSQEVADTAWFLHENLPERQLILGVDRLDYTKGIPAKYLAFERALEKFPELDAKISLVQIVVPSRADIPEYAKWKANIDQIAGRINSRFAHNGWTPIHYMYRSVPRTELLGYYRASEIGLVTPLKDGMNLVCKEYCACKVDLNGVLILSEFAGAADELKNGALMVNPYDREGVANAIQHAFHMNHEERAERMKKLRQVVMRNDVYRWVNSFLKVIE